MKKSSKKADIVAVAREAGTSIATVSRAFNHPDLVKADTRSRISDAVERLGYIRNRAAQSMHSGRSGTIGLSVPTIDHTIFAEAIQAFTAKVEAHGFSTLIASHGYDLDREYASLRTFLEHRVDGIAMIGLDHTPESHALLARHDIPHIAFWSFESEAAMSCVGADNAAAGALAAQHLIDLGHRDIAMVFPATDGNDRARDRFNAAMQTLEAAGLAPAKARIRQAPYSISAAKAAVLDVIGGATPPTAVLCGNDVIATGGLYAVQSQGLAVPGDISIMGIGDFKGSRDIEPALSTVHIPATEIGETAGDTLARTISMGRQGIIRHKCEITLRARATTAPPKR